jgi:accessory gene regulator protein AgrB
MVDARDLKSLERITHTGSSPVPGTKQSQKRDNTALFSYLILLFIFSLIPL